MGTLISDDPTAFGMRLAAVGREHPMYFDEGIGLPVILRKPLQRLLRTAADRPLRA